MDNPESPVITDSQENGDFETKVYSSASAIDLASFYVQFKDPNSWYHSVDYLSNNHSSPHITSLHHITTLIRSTGFSCYYWPHLRTWYWSNLFFTIKKQFPTKYLSLRDMCQNNTNPFQTTSPPSRHDIVTLSSSVHSIIKIQRNLWNLQGLPFCCQRMFELITEQHSSVFTQLYKYLNAVQKLTNVTTFIPQIHPLDAPDPIPLKNSWISDFAAASTRLRKQPTQIINPEDSQTLNSYPIQNSPQSLNLIDYDSNNSPQLHRSENNNQQFFLGVPFDEDDSDDEDDEDFYPIHLKREYHDDEGDDDDSDISRILSRISHSDDSDEDDEDL